MEIGTAGFCEASVTVYQTTLRHILLSINLDNTADRNPNLGYECFHSVLCCAVLSKTLKLRQGERPRLTVLR